MIKEKIEKFLRKKHYLYLLVTIFFLFYYIVFLIFINTTKKNAIKAVLSAKLREEKTHVDVSIKNMEYIMFHYIEHHLLKENKEAINLFAKAIKTSNKKKRNKIRKELYYKLLPLYNELKKIGITQIHFHTKDFKSFLRMDKPEKYEDDLRKVRPSVVYVNTYKKPWFGFEIGKSLPGFRYIVPIVINGEHIGSVEMVWRVKDFYRFLLKTHENEYPVFLLKASKIKEKLFTEFKKYYTISPFRRNWLLKKDWITKKQVYQIIQKLSKDKKFLKILNSDKEIGYYLKLNNKSYSVVKIPFKNIKGELCATLIFLADDNNIKLVLNIYKRELIFGSFGLILSYLLILIIYHMYLKIEKERNLFKTLTDTLEAGIYIVKEKEGIIFVNPMALKLLGYSFEEIRRKEPHYIFHADALGGVPLEECPVIKTLKKGETFKADIELIRKDGTKFWAYMIATPLFENRKFIGRMIIFIDITERKQLEEKLRSMAITDPLTGLFNRRHAFNILKKEKSKADRGISSFCIVLIDIDNFKNINDTYGHDIGDEVLINIASFLKKNLRAYDVVARWGGEEFLVILPNINIKGAAISAERIRKAIEKMDISGIKTTVSLGVTCYKPVESLNKTIKRADEALYEAKKQGKNKIIIKMNGIFYDVNELL